MIEMLVSIYVTDSFVSCVFGPCIVVSCMMKIRKCLTLFCMRAKPCLAAEINKTVNCLQCLFVKDGALRESVVSDL